MIQINVRLAEPFWSAAGQRNLSLEMNEGTQVGEVMALLRHRYPALSKDLDEAPPLIYVDDEEADAETTLADGSHVYVIWAIAGG